MKPLKELKKFDTFRYKKYDIIYQDNNAMITFYYEIDQLSTFETKIEIPVSNPKLNQEYVNYLAFHIGLIESISYWKCTCPYHYVIECGSLDKKQEEFFQKIFFCGLGEFFYTNHIKVEKGNMIHFVSKGKSEPISINYHGTGNMIAVGGGKDSCVSLKLLQKEENTTPFMINSKKVMIECAKAAGFHENEMITIKRKLDKKIIDLNEKGFLNGHTPFSAMVAFVSYLAAYFNQKKNIVLSNESSANESNIIGTKINHQYSKTFEFEADFNNYQREYFGNIIHYFSLLRPLSEYQIGMLFSQYKEFHQVFKSCNPGSKNEEWQWCGTCPKCLFIYTILSPYLYKEELTSIFSKDLFEEQELLETFKELLGYVNTKPFDCVGTFEEMNYAVYQTINNLKKKNLPFLLQYYYENYYQDLSHLKLETKWNPEHNLEEKYKKIVEGAIYD